MNPHGRPKGSYRSTQCEGTPVNVDLFRAAVLPQAGEPGHGLAGHGQ
jgi:hypothetical protein